MSQMRRVGRNNGYWVVGLVLSCLLVASVVSAKTTVEIWTPFNSGVHHDAFNALVEEFNETHTDIYVEHYGQTGFKAEKYVMGMLSRVLPDIGWVAPSWIMDLYSDDVLVPIDDLAARDGFDTSSFWPGAWHVRVNGHQWGMPFEIGSDAVVYNNDLFSYAGLASPKPTWTWDDFVSVARKLTVPKETYGFQRLSANYQVIQWIWRNGGNIVSEDETKATFTDPKAIEALQWFADLSLVHSVVGGNFSDGTAAMFVSHPGWYQANEGYWSFEPGTAPTPIPQGGTRASSSYYKEFVLFRSTPEKQEAAWTFLQWLMEPDRIAEWYVTTGYLPVSREILMTSTYQFHLMENPWLNPYVAELDYTRDQIDDNVLQLFSEAVSLAVSGKMTAQGAMEAMQPTVQLYLDEKYGL
jgi:multiple sugar transport system substrate-binding protein